MKLITIVKNLQNAGIDIKYRVRSDGGILVTEVRGLKFTGAEGNKYVRNLTGEQLSPAQVKQRQQIKPKKGQAPKSRKLPPVPDDVKKKIQRLQRLYNKDKTKGKPTIRNYRYAVDKYGVKKAEELLEHSEQYILGLAYDENIDAIIARLQQIANILESTQEDASPIYECIVIVRNEKNNHRQDFTQDKVQYLLDIIYEFEKEWNTYQSGGDSEYSDPSYIISNFVSDFKTTATARYGSKKK